MPKGWAERIENHICPVCNKRNGRYFSRTNRLYGTAPRCCSPPCTKIFWEKAHWSADAKGKVFKRDNHTCVKCGANNESNFEWRKRFFAWARSWTGGNLPKGIHTVGVFKQWFNEKTGKYTTCGEHYRETTGDKEPGYVQLEDDHIKPIALGGDEYDLKNRQTLCSRCHKRKTARESKLFAAARKGIDVSDLRANPLSNFKDIV